MRIASLFLAAALSLPAAIMSSANGSTLKGGTVTVFWDNGGGSLTLPIGVLTGFEDSGRIGTESGGTTTAFNFRVDNETLSTVNGWRIGNNRAGFNITAFRIDLTTAINGSLLAVFDSGAPLGSPSEAPGSDNDVPTSFGGGAGPGVLAVSGGTIASFDFSLPFTAEGGTNMWSRLDVTLGGTGLAPATSAFPNYGPQFVFRADSDLATVPEPSTWLTALAFCAAGLYRRNRRS